MINLINKLRNKYFKGCWAQILFFVVLSLLVIIGGMYGIGAWYRHSQASKPLELGVSFIPAYADSLGVDPQTTMQSLIDDIGVRNFRLVSYWDQLEPSAGKYNFSLLDWQFVKAEKAHATITLSVGLRQPRWPECHMPAWATNEPVSVWQPQLEAFMTQVIQRYKGSPALQSYQLENEYFMQGFGTCTNFDRQRLVDEYALVKKLDPSRPVIITRSNNLVGWPVGKPTPDEFATSIYRRVWNTNIYKGYFDYPVPAWYYSFIAGWQKIFTGRDMMIHELQAEAWPPNRQTVAETSLAEQNKSFNASMFQGRVDFAKATGMRQIYLWGGEYWYYRMVVLHDPSLWSAAKSEFQQN